MKFIAAVLVLLAIVATSATAGPVPETALSRASVPLKTEPVPMLAEPEQKFSHRDQMLLDEYQLADSVKSRVLGDLKIYGAVLSLALAFIGFLGFHVLVDMLSRRIEKAAKDDLEAIRSRTQTALIDVELAVRDGQRSSNAADEQVATLRKRHAELEDLAAKYQTLHAQVQSIGQLVERAANAAAESKEKVAGLGLALTNTFAGTPAIFTTSFDFRGRGVIGGRNFGEVPGKLHLLFDSTFVAAPGLPPVREEMGSFDLDGQDIEKWTDTSIVFQLSDLAMQAVTEFRAVQEERWKRLDPRNKGEATHGYDFVVERVDGSMSDSLKRPRE